MSRRRYAYLFEEYRSTADLRDKLSILEKKVTVAEHDMAYLHEEQDLASGERDEAVTQANSLKTTLEEE